MAQITVNVPDAVAPRVANAVATKFRYDAAVDGTKLAFAQKQIGIWLKSIVFEVEAQQAKVSAVSTARTSVDTDIVIT